MNRSYFEPFATCLNDAIMGNIASATIYNSRYALIESSNTVNNDERSLKNVDFGLQLT